MTIFYIATLPILDLKRITVDIHDTSYTTLKNDISYTEITKVIIRQLSQNILLLFRGEEKEKFQFKNEFFN